MRCRQHLHPSGRFGRAFHSQVFHRLHVIHLYLHPRPAKLKAVSQQMLYEFRQTVEDQGMFVEQGYRVVPREPNAALVSRQRLLE